MLLRERRIERMKCRRKDRVAGHVQSPIVKGHAPRIGAVIRAKAGQPLVTRLEPEPAAVLLADRSVRSLHLRVMEDRFPPEQIAVGGPGEVVQRVMGVFGAEAAQEDLPQIGLAVAVGILEERQVRHLRDIHPAVAELE